MAREKFTGKRNFEEFRKTIMSIGEKRYQARKSKASVTRKVAARRHLLGDKNTEEIAEPDSNDLGR